MNYNNQSTTAPRPNPSLNTSTSSTTASANCPVHHPATIINRTEVNMPTEVREFQPTVHEQVRRERVEEVQPVINIEKVMTQVVHKTQPLFDKEVKPLTVEERTERSEVLPDVVIQGEAIQRNKEVSTVDMLGTSNLVVEKPPIYRELDRLKIVEEIQPVIYKETIVPTLVKETKPIYQKIIEAPTHSNQILPPLELNQSHFRYPTGERTVITTEKEAPAATTFLTTKEVHKDALSKSTPPLQTSHKNPNIVSQHGFHNAPYSETIVTTTTTTTEEKQPNMRGNVNNVKMV